MGDSPSNRYVTGATFASSMWRDVNQYQPAVGASLKILRDLRLLEIWQHRGPQTSKTLADWTLCDELLMGESHVECVGVTETMQEGYCDIWWQTTSSKRTKRACLVRQTSVSHASTQSLANGSPTCMWSASHCCTTTHVRKLRCHPTLLFSLATVSCKNWLHESKQSHGRRLSVRQIIEGRFVRLL